MAQIKYASIYGAGFVESFAGTLQVAKGTDGKTAIQLIRLVKRISEESKTLDTVRMGIIDEYAKRGTDGEHVIESGNYVLSDDGIRKFNQALAECFECEPVVLSKIKNLDNMEAGHLVIMLNAGLIVGDETPKASAPNGSQEWSEI